MGPIFDVLEIVWNLAIGAIELIGWLFGIGSKDASPPDGE